MTWRRLCHRRDLACVYARISKLATAPTPIHVHTCARVLVLVSGLELRVWHGRIGRNHSHGGDGQDAGW